MTSLPSFSKVVSVQKSQSSDPKYLNDAVLEEKSITPLKKGQILVKINAASFNHRDVRLRFFSYSPNLN